MDELEISGRRYISTRRAAKEHKYHSDYIGQLIRGKKVDGQKVGRSWYVDADSLAIYLGKEGGPRGPMEKSEPITAPTLEVVEETVEEIDEAQPQILEAEPEVEEVEVVVPTPKKVVSPVTPIKIRKQEIVEEIGEEKIEEAEERGEVEEEAIEEKEEADEEIHKIAITKIMPRVPQKPVSRGGKGGLVYAADDKPLFPAILSRVPKIVVKEEAIEREVAQARIVERPASRKSLAVVRRGLMVVAVGGVALAVVALLSSTLVSQVEVKKGEPATVKYGFDMNSASF